MTRESFTITPSSSVSSLSPAEVEQELSRMWRDAQGDDENSSPLVMRVILGNVIWIGQASGLNEFRPVLDEVIQRYPCRLFIAEYDPDDGKDRLGASTNAQCYLPQKGAPPVCCEVIRLQFGPKSARHLRGAIAPLLLPDLRTVLIENLAGQQPDVLESLRPYADRTVMTTAFCPDVPAALRRIADGPGSVFDLAWLRLIPVRDQMTSFFDDPDAAFDLRDVQSVRLATLIGEQESRLPELMAALLIGWLASRLGWHPISPERYQSENGPVEATIQPACSITGPPANHVNSLELRDRKDRIFSMVMAEQEKTMDMWCGRKLSSPDCRRIHLSEFSSAESIGVALNTPMSSTSFRDAARLALPMLENQSG